MTISLRKKNVVLTTLTSATRTASATGPTETGFAGVDSIIFHLAVTAVSGAVPNMVVVVEDSIDNINWNNIVTFTAATTVTAEKKIVSGPFCNSIRTRSTITGTTPSLTFSVVAQSEGRH